MAFNSARGRGRESFSAYYCPDHWRVDRKRLPTPPQQSTPFVPQGVPPRAILDMYDSPFHRFPNCAYSYHRAILIDSSLSCRGSTGAGRLGHQVGGPLRLGEGDAVADVVQPAKSITQRSMPRAMPPCGGAPYCRASSRKPNRSRASARSMPSSPNTCCCSCLVVDTDRAAAGLGAVDHQVVGLGAALAGIGRQQLAVLRPRRGERDGAWPPSRSPPSSQANIGNSTTQEKCIAPGRRASAPRPAACAGRRGPCR